MEDPQPVYQDEQNATVARASMEARAVAIETPIPTRVIVGLLRLLESAAYARDVAEDPWEFSVRWSELGRLGLTDNDGRWLIRRGLVQHASETTATDDVKRSFVACKSPRLSACTCLILTEDGFRVALQIAPSQVKPEPVVGQVPYRDGSSAGLLDGQPAQTSVQPVWDHHRRELRVSGRIVKEFKVPAPNQEMVLDVFEEENWPPRIDDPLPPKPGITSQRRLHDTINSLNRNQRHQLIRFFADGLGKGVRWELVDESNAIA